MVVSTSYLKFCLKIVVYILYRRSLMDKHASKP